MRITGVGATPVRMPEAEAFYEVDGAGTRHHWHGRRSRITPKRPVPVFEYVIVRIDTDGGVAGLGEASADIGFFGETVEQVAIGIEDYLGPRLVGKDPFDREYLLELIDYRGNTCARAGIDMALHDLIGKALGVSVAVLLGGRHATAVPVAIEIAGAEPDDMAQACVSLLDRGVRAFKAKIGGSPDADADRLWAIRDAVGPHVSLRADANQGYTPKDAIRLCRIAERRGVNLELLEQPTPAWDLVGMAAVKRAVDVPIEADESCYSVHDAMHVIQHEAADVLNVKIGKAGGLYNAKKIAAIAQAAGVRCVLGTAFGLGLEIAAKLMLAASTQGVVDAVEFTELDQHGNLLAPCFASRLALPCVDGCLPVPDGPGLGVELDMEQVSSHRL